MTRALITSVVIGLGTQLLGATHGAACRDISSEEKSRLAAYVVKKYKVPEQAKLRVEEVQPVDDLCNRKLAFAGDGALGTFRLTLYASPDLRFLSRELYDTYNDPERERREAAQKAMGELLDGEYAARGSARAPVTMVVFSDFECPYCKKLKELIDTEPLLKSGDKVRLVFRHMPISQHHWAQQAAEVAACAQFQSSDAFWALHDRIFENQEAITPADAPKRINDLATEVPGLDMERFRECQKRQMSLGAVIRDREMGRHAGVLATPTIFLNGVELPGVRNGAELHRYLSDALRKNKEEPLGEPSAGDTLWPKTCQPVKKSSSKSRY
jgi:protein-disulfide isomerase